MQDHPKHCRCYDCYMVSPQWKRTKKKALKLSRTNGCDICQIFERYEWHHFKGYDAIWTDQDYLYISKICRHYHQLCHFKDGKKIPLTRKELEPRYWFLKRTHKIRTFRPSTLLRAVFGRE